MARIWRTGQGDQSPVPKGLSCVTSRSAPPPCIFVLAILSGSWLLLHPARPPQSTLRMWTFAKNHYDTYVEAAKSFEAAHPGVKVDVQIVSGQAVTSRLQAAFWADLDVPDLVEVEISSAGSFFRGPLQGGRLPGFDRPHPGGRAVDGMVRARFAPYQPPGVFSGSRTTSTWSRSPTAATSSKGRHRRRRDPDLGRPDPRRPEADHPQPALPARGSPTRAPRTSRCALFQRGGGYFDPQGKCILDNDVAVETMRWYVPLVAGEGKIGNSLGGGQILTRGGRGGLPPLPARPGLAHQDHREGHPALGGQDGADAAPGRAPRRLAHQHARRDDAGHHQALQEPGPGVAVRPTPVPGSE